MQKKFYIPPVEKTHDLGGNSDAFKTVLLLEDEGDLTEVLTQLLEIHHFRVTTAKNGVEGLKKIIAGDFDAIVCDMMMPNLPGDMFYLAVEKTKPHLCKRFIFMTGHKGDKKIDDFIRRVRGVLLWKPFQPHELVDSIKAVIRKTSDAI